MKLACSAGRQALVLVALSILWPACRGADPGALAPAELLFRNGAVYTVNPAEPWAQAVAISRAGCCSPVSATLTSTR